MVVNIKIKKLEGIQTRPTASLPFYQYSACGLANHPDDCMLEPECMYNGLVYMTIANLEEIDRATSI